MMQRKSIYIVLSMVIILLTGLFSVTYGDNAVGLYPPQPKDVTVLVTKPTISRQFILNSMKIKSVEMQLNNKNVDVKYDEVHQTVYYKPQEPLKPGSYKVNLSVNLEGVEKPLAQTWQFTVSSKAVDELQAPTSEQRQALVYANIYRKLLNLKELQIDSSLSTAAVAHSNYMAANKTLTHDEFANKNGFTDTTVYGRAGAFGYSGSYVFENVSSGQKDYKEAVDGLFTTPYHRLMWINPFLTDFGYGSKDKYYTIDLGGKRLGEDNVVVYPMDKQGDVPISWDGNETPNPLRLHPKKGTVGYPITLSYFSEKNITKFTVLRTTLTNSKGSTISIFTNTPSFDKQLTDSIIIIPQNTLAKGEKYTVTVKGKVEFQDKTSVTLDKSWSFTTAATDVEENAWKNKYLYIDIENHWARDNILELLNKQIISPKTETEYRPNDRITRAEFAEFIVKAMGLQTKAYEGSLKDVQSDNSRAIFIESAFRDNIIKGVGNGYFMPNNIITREEMAVMIVRAYEKKKGTGALQSMPSLSFTDKSEISWWATDSVRATNHLGIVKGRTTSKFVPKDSATRAEAAVMVKRMLETF